MGDDVKETGCCPKFDPTPWESREFTFKEKMFVKDRVFSIFHIPLNFGSVMTKNMALIEKAGAKPKNFMVLSDENSMWGSDVYIAADKEVPEAKMEKLSGKFLSRVFEGQYKEMGSWIKEMEGYLRIKKLKAERMFFWYTTCPKCAKAYGKNYVVIIAKIG